MSHSIKSISLNHIMQWIDSFLCIAVRLIFLSFLSFFQLFNFQLSNFSRLSFLTALSSYFFMFSIQLFNLYVASHSSLLSFFPLIAPLLLHLQHTRLLPRLSVSLPSFFRSSSFLHSPLCLSRRSLGPSLSSPPPHFIENVWYAGAFYTGTEPPPRRPGLMASKEQPGRLLVRTFVSEEPRRNAWPSTLAAKV